MSIKFRGEYLGVFNFAISFNLRKSGKLRRARISTNEVCIAKTEKAFLLRAEKCASVFYEYRVIFLFSSLPGINFNFFLSRNRMQNGN